MLRLCVFVSVILILSSSRLFGQFLIRTIAVTDRPSDVNVTRGSNPIIESVTFASLLNPVVNSEGNVAFSGSIDIASADEAGVWFYRTSAQRLELIAKDNSPAPAAWGVARPDTFFGSTSVAQTFGPLKIYGTDITFRARLKGGSTTTANDTAVYYEAPLQQMVREGDIFDPRDNSRVGDLFEFANLSQDTTKRTLPLINTDSTKDTAVQNFPIASYYDVFYPREGQRVSSGINLGDVRDARPLLTWSDRTAPRTIFRSTVTGPGIDATNDERILYADFGHFQTRQIASEGDLPSNARDVQFDSFFHPATGVSRAGLQLIFYGVSLSGVNVNTSNDSAIALSTLLPSQNLFLREGQQLFGGPAGVVLGDLGTDNLVGGEQHSVLFNNQLRGLGITEENDWALVVGQLGLTGGVAARILAQEGAHVDGLPANSVLSGLDRPHFQFTGDDAIFNADFVGPNGTGRGLFHAQLDQTAPRLIVRTGQELDIGGGVFKTISDIGLIEMANPWDGRASQMNDAGQITFSLTFTDGSQGIFMAVPEPGTIVLAGVSFIVLTIFAVRRRRISN
jgi:hypothetical protein